MSKRCDFSHISMHEGPKQSPGFLLWHISTAWRKSIESTLKPFGLTHPQFVVLAATGWLTRKGELVSQVAIGTMAGLDPNTNSQVLKGLEQKSLITRGVSSDGRAKSVSLTTQGAVILTEALPAVELADRAFFNPLKNDELNTLMEGFHRLMQKKEKKHMI